MTRHSFFCIDGHTCGEPARLVVGGAPTLRGETMLERKQDFEARFDWLWRALMHEPRGSDIMVGALLYPPLTEEADASLVFIEVDGVIPMCGHATIATATYCIEEGLVTPKTPGKLAFDTPAGLVRTEYEIDGDYVESVRIYNVDSFLAHRDVTIISPDLGEITCDVAYGGNFYAILEPQKNYKGLEHYAADEILRMTPPIWRAVEEARDIRHPEKPGIGGIHAVMWTGAPKDKSAHGRNAVVYSERAIDRSPCGTGTSARMAQLAARGKLGAGEPFIHESIIGSLFEGRIEAQAELAGAAAIRPSVKGWARITGHNTIFVDSRDPYAHGFIVE